MSRQIIIEDDKLKALLEKKDEAVADGKKQYAAVEREQNKLNKCGLKIQKMKDKIIPLVNAQEFEKTEFEEIQSVSIEDGKIVMTVFDLVEEYKEAVRTKRNEESTDNSGEGGEGKDGELVQS